MNRSRLSLAVFLGAAALCVAQALRYAPLLPRRMASHFGPGGTPNGWMPREIFIKLDIGVVGFLTLMLLSASFKFRSLDPAKMRLPNRDYWMAPERREATVEFLSGYFLWFGAATLLLMLDVFRQVFLFNLGASKALDHPLTSLGVYVAFVIAWIAGFQLRFRKIPG